MWECLVSFVTFVFLTKVGIIEVSEKPCKECISRF